MRSFLLVSLIFVSAGQTFGQAVHKIPLQESRSAQSYPIDPMPFLQKQYQEAADYNRAHPEFAQNAKLQKTASWGFSVGSTKSWWVYNMATSTYYSDASTCRKVGTHCYIFVEDSLWTNGHVTQAAVDSIANDFDNKTPADTGKGIYLMDTGAFGDPPDVDSDPKIVIFILNIQDGYNGTGGYVAGFFDPAQEIPGSHSNQAEIYYVDANPTDLTSAYGIEVAMSTAAHEFQHMINYNYHSGAAGKPLEPIFINEGCSMVAELYCGYPPANLSLYANETNHYLFDWRRNDNTLVLNDYARAQRFLMYFWDRYGIGILKNIVQSTKTTEIAIVNDALTTYGISANFNNVFPNWLIANELNDTTSNRLYGYAYPGLPASNGRQFFNPNVSVTTDTVQRIGCRYLIFKAGSGLSVTFSNPSSSANLSVVAMEMGSGTNNVVNVPFGTPFSVPDFGSTYSTVAFAVINTDPANSIVYTYQASGAAQTTVSELRWEDSEPVGYYIFTANDTICVTFDAYPGGTLDSIRVALRRPGSIAGGIYRAATAGSTPLGQLLVRDTATISTETTLPYPKPYQNWTTVNLSSHNISTDQAFAVAFIIGSVPNTPGVMITSVPGTSAYHNYTYLSTSDNVSTPGWYFISSGTDSIALYLIHAYVRFTTGVTQEITPIPTQFSLGQNFPNPFNPSTEITYQIAKAGYVRLEVYDILGREVAELVDKREAAGRYSVTFDASGLPSGVYFYRLTTNEKVGVKKMVLLK